MDKFLKVMATILSVFAMVTANINGLFNGEIYPYESETLQAGGK